MTEQMSSVQQVQQEEPTNASVDVMDFPMDDSAPLTPQDKGGSTPPDSSNAGEGDLFFADAMLDLNEAHDIAETPEPKKLIMSSSTSLPNVEMPQSENQVDVPKVESTTAKLGPNTEAEMSRLDGGKEAFAVSIQASYRPRPPRRPRDMRWAIVFFIVVPLSLLTASCLSTSIENGSAVAISRASRRSSSFAVFCAFAIALGCARLMYRTMGGGDGDDARHIASQFILAFAPISLGIHALLVGCIFLKFPNAFSMSLIPIWFLGRDLFAMRQWRTTASTAGGRQAFFQALCNMALDILSRSLRRSSFYRAVVVLLSFQFVVVWCWRAALLGALRHGSSFWLLVALITGKWATGTSARLLGLVASGGVTTWFVHQSHVIDELEQKRKSEKTNISKEGQSIETNVPEEYREADASAYQSVLEIDDGIDDDFEDEEPPQGQNNIWSEGSNSNVMSFVKSALTISLGSVVQCGLLGGVAQFIWSVLRNVDAMSTALMQRFPVSSKFGFRGMQIGNDGAERIGFLFKIFEHVNSSARLFVRNHTDLAMCQVAAYYKSYQRAARDVAVLVDGSGESFMFFGGCLKTSLISFCISGMEPIIHDDISVSNDLVYFA